MAAFVPPGYMRFRDALAHIAAYLSVAAGATEAAVSIGEAAAHIRPALWAGSLPSFVFSYGKPEQIPPTRWGIEKFYRWAVVTGKASFKRDLFGPTYDGPVIIPVEALQQFLADDGHQPATPDATAVTAAPARREIEERDNTEPPANRGRPRGVPDEELQAEAQRRLELYGVERYPTQKIMADELAAWAAEKGHPMKPSTIAKKISKVGQEWGIWRGSRTDRNR